MRTSFLLLILLLLSQNVRANVVGNGLQNFNPIPSGIDFVTVHSSEPLKPGLINIGLYLNQAVNSLPYFEGQAQTRTNFNDLLYTADFNVGVGLLPNWEVGLSAPFLLYQDVKTDQTYHGEFGRNGNTEIRVMTKYRLWGDDSGGFALVGSANFNRTANNPYIGDGAGPVFNFEAAWDTTIRKWALGLNLGYRKTQPGSPVPGSLIEPIGDQIIGSLGASYLLNSLDTKLIFEIFGSAPAQKKSSNPDRNASALELLGGVKHDLNMNWALHAGAGTELAHGVSSPDWRLYAGVNYTFGPVFGSTRTTDRPSVDRLTIGNILFEFDSDQLKYETQEVVEEVYSQILVKPFRRLTIVGHTDSIGRTEYNQELSQRRADAIRNYLIEKKGIPASKIESIGKGEGEPVADNGNFQGRQQNRRVEFIVER